MSWSVGLIDDEPLVRNHLRSLLDWEKEGFVLCGEAGDGLQALELIESQQPDVVIVDMSMPGMNGLELTRYLAEEKPRLKIIALSSYDSFDYVRGTLSYGAVDYLLKHRLTSGMLAAVLGKVRKQLEEREAQSRVKELADITLARTVLRDHLLGIETDLQPLEQYFAENTHGTGKSRWVVLLVQLAHYDVLAARLGEQELGRYLRSVTDLCEQAAGGYPWSCTTLLDHGRWAVLLTCGKERSEHAIAQWVTAKGARLESSLKIYMNLAATLLTSPIYSSLDHSRAAYRKLVDQIKGVAQQSNDRGIITKSAYVTIRHEKRLLAAMEAADALEAEVIIREIMGTEEQEQGTVVLLERVSAELVQIAAKIARKADIPADWMVEELSIFQRPGLTNEQAEATVCGIYARLAKDLQRLQISSGYSRHVTQALELIAGRYRDGITLEETAEKLGITPSYLSRLFKEETGRTFTEFLTEHRIERSKQLLLEGDTPFKELYAKLGFSSYSYFIRVFKEATGETPYAYAQRMKDRSES
jgi:two-component system, response regulator YesN